MNEMDTKIARSVERIDEIMTQFFPDAEYGSSVEDQMTKASELVADLSHWIAAQPDGNVVVDAASVLGRGLADFLTERSAEYEGDEAPVDPRELSVAEEEFHFCFRNRVSA